VLQQAKALQKLTKDAYHHLHNAFIAKKVTKEDLFGKGVFGNVNLVFSLPFISIGA
jgi:hypothetical protein